MSVYLLGKEPFFPDPNEADPDGLIAIGGDFSAQRLLNAYVSGIFPWFEDDKDIYWFSPDPRLVLYPDKLKIPVSLGRIIKQGKFEIRFNYDFKAVMEQCARVPRKHEEGTWISGRFIRGYTRLHKLGFAHSAEAYHNGTLAGGLYGIAIGRAFFGESMFYLEPDASKVAFVSLVQEVEGKRIYPHRLPGRNGAPEAVRGGTDHKGKIPRTPYRSRKGAGSITFVLLRPRDEQMKGKIAFTAIVILAVLSSIPAVRALLGNDTRIVLEGTIVTGPIPVIIDPLAAWFILVINFTFITSALYGLTYMKGYENRTAAVSMHWISYLFTHAGILLVCIVQNSIVFLIAWEIMAVGTFLLVIFESTKAGTIKAGLNYLIQSHVGVLLLTLAFLWVAAQTGSYSFDEIRRFALTRDPGYSLLLMLLFFAGFGIKAGFVPFHTWLPLAHPAAPSHVSGMMSGVLIKIGIYGILRMIFLLNTNYLVIGYFILGISVLTGRLRCDAGDRPAQPETAACLP